MKTLRVVQVRLHAFLTFALNGCEWLTSRPVRCTLGNEHRYPLNSRPGAQPGTGYGAHYWIAIFGTSLISRGKSLTTTVITQLARIRYDITHYVGWFNVWHQSNYCSIGRAVTKICPMSRHTWHGTVCC